MAPPWSRPGNTAIFPSQARDVTLDILLCDARVLGAHHHIAHLELLDVNNGPGRSLGSPRTHRLQ